MALPFPFTSLYQFPIGITTFLGSKDILTLSTVNRSLCHQLLSIRCQQKWKVAEELVGGALPSKIDCCIDSLFNKKLHLSYTG
jgi:hypothetical protein